MARTALATAAIVLAGILSATLLAAEDPPSKRQAEELLDRMVRELNGRIELSGAVTDENGHHLSTVTMFVRRSAFDAALPSFTRDQEERRTVDDWYEVSCDPCSSIHLRFSTDGHHDRTVSVYLDEVGTKGEHRVLSRPNLDVQLRTIGRLARLERHSGYLEYAADGVQTVLPLARGFDGSTARLDRVVKRATGDVESDLAEAGPSLFLRAQRSDDGSLKAMAGSRSSPEHAGVPAPVALRSARPDDGLLVFDPGDEGNPAEVLRSMTAAPTEGYSSELVLDSTDGERVYFYCRIGDRYGKGTALPPLFAGGRQLVVSSYCEVFLNAEPGDTNLESY